MLDQKFHMAEANQETSAYLGGSLPASRHKIAICPEPEPVRAYQSGGALGIVAIIFAFVGGVGRKGPD